MTGTRLSKPKFGIDSTGMIAPHVHHSVGSSFAARYTSRYTPKAITAGEYGTYRQNDIGLLVVFEDGADNALKGYDQGKADAEFAVKQTDAAGRPKGRPILAAVDFDSSGNPGAIDSYFDGWAAVLGRNGCGPYGGYSTVARTFERGFAWAWQTYAWSGGRVHPQAQVLQYSNDQTVGGTGVDFDRAFFVDYGQWGFISAPADPHHYHRFPEPAVKITGRTISERKAVIAYDALRARQTRRRHPGQHELTVLRGDLRLAAGRIYAEVQRDRHRGPHGRLLPAAYTPWHRGWRLQQLLHRSQGRRLV